MRAYKVVSVGRDGRMHSLVKSRALRRTYDIGVTTRPVEGTRLFVFKGRDYAESRDCAESFMRGLGRGPKAALLVGEAQEARPQRIMYIDGFDTTKSSALAFWETMILNWQFHGAAPSGTYSCESFTPEALVT